MDTQKQSTFSQTMSCSKYLTNVNRIMTTPFALCGNGSYWHTYAENGDKSYLLHHSVSISKYSARAKLWSRRNLISGQLFLSVLNIATMGKAKRQKGKATLLLHLPFLIVYTPPDLS